MRNHHDRDDRRQGDQRGDKPRRPPTSPDAARHIAAAQRPREPGEDDDQLGGQGNGSKRLIRDLGISKIEILGQRENQMADQLDTPAEDKGGQRARDDTAYNPQHGTPLPLLRREPITYLVIARAVSRRPPCRHWDGAPGPTYSSHPRRPGTGSSALLRWAGPAAPSACSPRNSSSSRVWSRRTG